MGFDAGCSNCLARRVIHGLCPYSWKVVVSTERTNRTRIVSARKADRHGS
jgi:uncharacterized DUF497 family protein